MTFFVLFTGILCFPLLVTTIDFDIPPYPAYRFRTGWYRVINPYIEILKPQGLRYTFKNMSEVKEIHINANINTPLTGNVSDLIYSQCITEIENNMRASTVISEDYLISLKENDKFYFMLVLYYSDTSKNFKIFQNFTTTKDRNGNLLVSNPSWDNTPRSQFDYMGTLNNTAPWHVASTYF